MSIGFAQKCWIWFADRRDADLNSKAEIIERFGSAEAVFNAPAGALAALEGVSERSAEALKERSLERAEEIIRLCEEKNIQIITFDDAAYPASLKEIYAPPYVLYVRGKLPDFEASPAVAVIGTRKASPYGLKMGRSIAAELCEGGASVISLLSAGIDAKAAEGALEAGGQCIGVLGTAIDAANGVPAKSVCASGALVSEYAPGTPYRKNHFRERNRIAAGMACAVAVIEAPEKSGTRLFVAEALEQGKEIFALPGNADSESSSGTLRFIKEGATLVTSGREIISELAPAYRGRMVPKKTIDKPKADCYIGITEKKTDLPPEQAEIFKAIDSGCASVDAIIEKTGLPASTVLSQLTMLQIAGLVRKEPGKGFTVR